MAQNTAVQQLITYMEENFHLTDESRIKFEKAKAMENKQQIELLIDFQTYLSKKKLITNHDWDFEKLAKQFIKKEIK